MYASFPSAEATTSCGSGPVGAVPSTLSVAASIIAIVLSPLLMASSRSAAAAVVAVSPQVKNVRSETANARASPMVIARSLCPVQDTVNHMVQEELPRQLGRCRSRCGVDERQPPNPQPVRRLALARERRGEHLREARAG